MQEKRGERRRFRRANYPCEIYILTSPLRIIKCTTENIGAGGIRVIIDENLPISSTVGLNLYLSKKPIKSKGKVVWAVEKNINKEKAKFDTGLEFRQISQNDRKTIEAFVKSLV